MIRQSLLVLSFLALTACGFAPVYGPGPEGNNSGPIHIGEIEGRMGHFLRQELVRTIGQGVPGITGPAELEITASEKIARLAFKPDQAASRSDYIGSASWTLKTPDGVKIASGGANQLASFNFADAAYADIAAQTEAQNRVATLLAREIRTQIIVAAGKKQTPEQAAAAADAPGTGITGLPSPVPTTSTRLPDQPKQ